MEAPAAWQRCPGIRTSKGLDCREQGGGAERRKARGGTGVGITVDENAKEPSLLTAYVKSILVQPVPPT